MDWVEVKGKTKRNKSERMNEKEAMELQRKFDIEGFAKAMMSKESIDLQREGWIFSRVSTFEGPVPPGEYPEEETSEIEVGNKWGDILVYIRKYK